ncbi:MAG: hypothetical protein ACLR23_18695 [Clostridia bacterium]
MARCESLYRKGERFNEIRVLHQMRQTKIEVDAVTGVIRTSTFTGLKEGLPEGGDSIAKL